MADPISRGPVNGSGGPLSMGTRLRAKREQLGIGVRELARQIGISASFISQIERDRVSPSVQTLYQLATALGMTMGEIFTEPSAPQPGSHSPIVLPEERSVINLASGIRWERLTPVTDPYVEFHYVVYSPGSESCGPDSLMEHGGREYGYVVSGMLGIRIGFDEYKLGPGGSVSYDASMPHRLWAIGPESVNAIWAVVGRRNDSRFESLRRDNGSH
jgi:transcriptional regulator with XRE-family HTH domain